MKTEKEIRHELAVSDDRAYFYMEKIKKARDGVWRSYYNECAIDNVNQTLCVGY